MIKEDKNQINTQSNVLRFTNLINENVYYVSVTVKAENDKSGEDQWKSRKGWS